MATLATYAGGRFRSAKEVRGGHHGFWTLVDVVAPADLEDDVERRAEYRLSPDGKLTLLTERPLPGELRGPEVDGGREYEAKRLRRQARRLAARYVFSNLDCTLMDHHCPSTPPLTPIDPFLHS